MKKKEIVDNVEINKILTDSDSLTFVCCDLSVDLLLQLVILTKTRI